MKAIRLPAVAALVLLGLVAFAPQTAGQDDKQSDPVKPVDYLVIAADGLKAAAVEWAAYRAEHGRVTRVITISEIPKAKGQERPGLKEIKAAIAREAAGKEGKGGKPREGFQLLLIGDCPTEGTRGYDPKTEIPWMLTQDLDSHPARLGRRRIPTDNYYADLIEDDDRKPDIAVGRIPARTQEQVRIALRKVQAYEKAKLGKWSRRLTFFAGEGRFGPADVIIEKLFTMFMEQTVDQAFNVRMTYANIKSPYAYVPSRFSQKVIEEANRGALMLVYMGHGRYDRLDDMQVQVDGKTKRYPILLSDDVKDFDIAGGRLPIMLITACQTGYMDHRTVSLAERICFTERAPVAVVGASRDSHPYSNTLFQKAFISEITEHKRATLGSAILLAKREMVESKDPDRAELDKFAMWFLKLEEREYLNRTHMYLYNLTGDPGLRIRHRNVEVTLGATASDLKGGGVDELQVEAGGTLRVGIQFKPGLGVDFDSKPIVTGIELELQVRRSQLAGEVREFDLKGLTGDDPKARKTAEQIVMKNHDTANNKALAWFKPVLSSADVSKGQSSVFYEAKIDSGLAPGAYFLKVFARDGQGERCAFAAVKVTVVKESEKED